MPNERRQTARRCTGRLVLAAALGALAAVRASGQAPDALLEQVQLTQRVGESIPLELRFRDESGEEVALRRWFGRGPVVLVPVFYRCPMLCTQVLSALARITREVGFRPGQDYEIVVFSFDPRETPTLAAQKKLNHLRQMPDGPARGGWHFLVGDPPAIDGLCDAIGYRYAYDARRDQYAHPAAIVLLTPDGRVSRYVLGVDYDARTLRLALLDAGRGSIGSVVDRLLLRCYVYDPERSTYGLAVMQSLRVGGAVTILGLVALVGSLGRRRRRAAPGRGDGP